MQNLTCVHCYALKNVHDFPSSFYFTEAVQHYINQITLWLFQLLFLTLSFPAFPLLGIYLNAAGVYPLSQGMPSASVP